MFYEIGNKFLEAPNKIIFLWEKQTGKNLHDNFNWEVNVRYWELNETGEMYFESVPKILHKIILIIYSNEIKLGDQNQMTKISISLPTQPRVYQ